MILTLPASISFYFLFFIIEILLARVVYKQMQKASVTSFIVHKNGRKYLLIWALLAYMTMLIGCAYLAGARYEVGTDYKNYLPIFNTITSLSGESIYGTIEPLSAALMLICKPFADGYHLYLTLVSFFIALLTFRFFLKNSDYCSFPFMIFIYFMIMYSASLNALRQILAVAVVINGFQFILSRKFLKYVVIVIIAAGFHKAALLCIPFYFMYFEPNKYSKFKTNFIIAVSLLMPLFIDSIFSLLLRIPIFESFSRYTLREASTYGLHQLILRLPILFSIFLCRKKLEERNDSNRLYIILYMGELLSYTLGASITWAFRIAYFCLPAEAILVSQITKVANKYSRITINICLVCYYLFMFWYNVIKNGHDGILPYIFR